MSGNEGILGLVENTLTEHFGTAANNLRVQRTSTVAASVEPPYVTTMENFASMDHASIYAVTRAMKPEGLFAFAELWRSLGSEVGSVFSVFNGELGAAMSGWTGGSRDAAQSASRAYATTGEELAALVGDLSSRMTELGSAVSAAKLAVPPPGENTRTGTEILVPGSVLLKSAADEELRMQAVAAMTSIYEPSYGTAGVGSNVPAYFAPVDPAPGFGDGSSLSSSSQSQSSRNGSGSDTGASNSENAAAQAANSDAAEQDQMTAQNVTAESDTGGGDPGTTSSDTTTSQPADTSEVHAASNVPYTPSQLGSDTTRFTDSATPRVSSPAAPVTAQPVTGQPVVSPTTPGQAPLAAASPAARTAATSTRGMGPYMPGAGAAQRRDEDSEHKIPEYLITEENGRELFGEIPKTTPPVFGDWSERT